MVFVKITNYRSDSGYYCIRTGARIPVSRRWILYFKKGMVTNMEVFETGKNNQQPSSKAEPAR